MEKLIKTLVNNVYVKKSYDAFKASEILANTFNISLEDALDKIIQSAKETGVIGS